MEATIGTTLVASDSETQVSEAPVATGTAVSPETESSTFVVEHTDDPPSLAVEAEVATTETPQNDDASTPIQEQQATPAAPRKSFEQLIGETKSGLTILRARAKRLGATPEQLTELKAVRMTAEMSAVMHGQKPGPELLGEWRSAESNSKRVLRNIQLRLLDKGVAFIGRARHLDGDGQRRLLRAMITLVKEVRRQPQSAYRRRIAREQGVPVGQAVIDRQDPNWLKIQKDLPFPDIRDFKRISRGEYEESVSGVSLTEDDVLGAYEYVEKAFQVFDALMAEDEDEDEVDTPTYSTPTYSTQAVAAPIENRTVYTTGEPEEAPTAMAAALAVVVNVAPEGDDEE